MSSGKPSAPNVAETEESERQPERVSEWKLPGPVLLHESLRASGEEELKRSVPSLLFAGLSAGLSMGLSMVGVGVVHAHLPDASWRILLAGFGFSIGFVVVMVGRQGLITEQALTGLLPFLSAPRSRTFTRVLRLWGLVLAGNMVGAALFAWVAASTGAFSPEVISAFAETGHKEAQHGFATQLVKAVFAGWIIAMGQWISPAARSSRILVIVLLTWLVWTAELGHIISGSVMALVAVFEGEVSAADYLSRFFVPVLLGNMIGGSLLGAVLSHAHVAHEVRQLRRQAK